MDGTETLCGGNAPDVAREETGGAEALGPTLRLEGEWSIANAEDLHQLFETHVSRHANVVLDLTGVRACDTAAVQLICSLWKTSAQGGRWFRIAASSPAVQATASALGVPIGELAAPGKRQED